MSGFALALVVTGLRLVLIVQAGLLVRAIVRARRRDATVGPRFGIMACAECAICCGVSIAALLSAVELAFWPMVLGLAVLANVFVALVRWRLVLVGDEAVLVAGHVLARDALSCAFRGVSLHADAGVRFFAVPFPIARLDALVTELDASVL